MMRYLALIGISAVSMVFTACVTPNMPILGAQLDVMLAVMMGMILLEKTLTPVFYMAGAAVLMDAFFARALGFYALQYLLTGMTMYLVMCNRRIDTAAVMTASAGFWVLREVLGVVFCFLMDAPVGLPERFVYSILPGIIPQVLLGLGVFALLNKLYAQRFIWPIATSIDKG